IEAIDSVQKGDKDEEEIMINAPSVLIRPEITSVTLSDVLDNPPPDQYIETDEFRELVVIWKEKIPVRFMDKVRKHENKGKVILYLVVVGQTNITSEIVAFQPLLD